MTGERLLLVDDEDNLRSMLEAALRHSGFEVHPAANGRYASRARFLWFLSKSNGNSVVLGRLRGGPR